MVLKYNVNFIWCGLSLDGDKYAYDLNRCNSFESIGLDFFQKTYPEQTIKMTISENTLYKLCESVIFCHERGFLVNCNLAYNINWSDEKHIFTLQEELMKLIEYYLNNSKINACTILDYKIDRILLEGETRYCGDGIEMSPYCVDGKNYPCQFFMPLSVGVERTAERGQITFSSYPDQK